MPSLGQRLTFSGCSLAIFPGGCRLHTTGNRYWPYVVLMLVQPWNHIGIVSRFFTCSLLLFAFAPVFFALTNVWIRFLVQVTIYRWLRIGLDGHLDQSEANDIYRNLYESCPNLVDGLSLLQVFYVRQPALSKQPQVCTRGCAYKSVNLSEFIFPDEFDFIEIESSLEIIVEILTIPAVTRRWLYGVLTCLMLSHLLRHWPNIKFTLRLGIASN